MSRKKKYSTPAALRRACRRYICSVSRTVPVMEQYDTGKRDGFGHPIMAVREVKNDEGEVITYREFAVPPSITALCIYLGISRETWRRYISMGGEWRECGTEMREVIRDYLEREVMVRRKGIQGVIWNLEHNYSIEDADKACEALSEAVTPEAQAELIKSVAARLAELEEVGE